ncbi:hypothetical protein [Reinekea thalattae]|uniref:Transcriptional regulator SutA RNAP-binding domain-containing protein n=1 Tax=Reinekea thalattae TaxID=2593301 RepID=A0A5C8Z1D7_9GAMM|nr:hypothetical protein [Reinekea thalattae]TXR51885.1 hypothetical protein FME95_10680 [Reinekea thalattae]
MTAEKKLPEGPITTEELARTPKCNENVRSAMNSEVEKFLAQGGAVTQVESGYRADPPKKPESKYGSRPI